MNRLDEDLKRAVRDYANFSAADRRAISTHLTSAERAQLQRFLSQSKPKVAPPPRPTPPICSPWLTQVLLLRVRPDGKVKLTNATREHLLAVMMSGISP